MKFRPAPWSRARAGLLLALALLASVPAGVRAESASLAILGLSSKDGDDEAAAALTDALREQAALDSELTLSDSSALLSQLVVLHDCEIADAACRDNIASQLEVDELIYGAIRRADGGHRVELHRYAKPDGTLSHASRELTIEGASEAELARGARGLLRELRPSDAFEEPVVAPAPTTKPVRERRPLRPLSEPAEPEPQPDDEPSSNDWLGYSLLGVAAVSAGLTVFSWSEIARAHDDGDLRAYREAVGREGEGVDDVCAEADAGEAYGLSASRVRRVRSACARGATFEVLQWVFMGSALVSAGLGIFVLLDDEGEPDAASATLVPVLGRDDARLLLRVRM